MTPSRTNNAVSLVVFSISIILFESNICSGFLPQTLPYAVYPITQRNFQENLSKIIRVESQCNNEKSNIVRSCHNFSSRTKKISGTRLKLRNNYDFDDEERGPLSILLYSTVIASMIGYFSGVLYSAFGADWCEIFGSGSDKLFEPYVLAILFGFINFIVNVTQISAMSGAIIGFFSGIILDLFLDDVLDALGLNGVFFEPSSLAILFGVTTLVINYTGNMPRQRLRQERGRIETRRKLSIAKDALVTGFSASFTVFVSALITDRYGDAKFVAKIKSTFGNEFLSDPTMLAGVVGIVTFIFSTQNNSFGRAIRSIFNPYQTSDQRRDRAYITAREDRNYIRPQPKRTYRGARNDRNYISTGRNDSNYYYNRPTVSTQRRKETNYRLDTTESNRRNPNKSKGFVGFQERSREPSYFVKEYPETDDNGFVMLNGRDEKNYDPQKSAGFVGFQKRNQRRGTGDIYYNNQRRGTGDNRYYNNMNDPNDDVFITGLSDQDRVRKSLRDQ